MRIYENKLKMAQNTSGKQSLQDAEVETSIMTNMDDDPDDLEEGEIADEDDEINENDTKKQTETKIVSESIAATDKNSVQNNCSSSSSNNNGSNSGSSKTKKLPSNDAVKTKSDASSNKVSKGKILTLDNMTASDDWGRNVESAIAAVLRRDGIEPLQLPSSVVAKQKNSNESDNSCSGGGAVIGGQLSQSSVGTTKLSNSPDDDDRHGVKRRRKSRHQSSRSKRKKDTTNDLTKRVDSDEIDEFEMICMRGGSPPTLQSSSTSAMQLDDDQYYSDDSYSSYGSYDSDGGVGGGKRNTAGGRNYDDRKNRRRNKDQSSSISTTSRQQSGQQSGSMSRNSGGGNSRKSGRDKRSSGRRGDLSDNDDRSDNRNNGPRKLELCKFYLMECCAKREKCLYMHSDFPCKYYYLGMKPHNQNQCKFSHGKPLTDQLRNILLKHLETAPKEILGDFPRINRDIATNMLNIQHQKLLKDYGMDVMTTTTPSSSSSISVGSSSVIDDLIRRRIDDIVASVSTNLPIISSSSNTSLPSNVAGGTAKTDKPRKTRWCDRSPIKIQSQLNDNNETTTSISMIATVSTLSSTLPSSTTSSSSLSSLTSKNDCQPQTPSYLSLKNLTGVITNEQIEKLAAIGIENLEQINSLTVVQLNQYGLNINQIHELALNAKNMEKLGLVKGSIAAAAAVDDHHSNDSGSTVTFFGTGTGKDLDMRIPPTLTQQQSDTRTVTPELLTKNEQSGGGGGGDVDMRFLSPNSVATLKSDCIPFQNIIPVNTTSQLTSTVSSLPSTIAVNDPMMTKSNDRTAMMFNYSAYIHNSSDDDTVTEQKQKQSAAAALNDSLDYSKYLKDSNLTKIDLLDDDVAMVDNYYSTNRQTEDESGDEANNKLIIEEEMPLDADELWCEGSFRKDSLSKKMPNKQFHNSDDNNSNDTTNSSSDNNSNDSSKYDRDLIKSIEKKSNSLLPPPLPAIYDPSALYPSTKMNKIDISSSVTQYLNEGTTNKLSSLLNDDNNDDDLSFLLAFDTKRTKKTDTNTTTTTTTTTTTPSIIKIFDGSGIDKNNDNVNKSDNDNNDDDDDEPLSSFVVSNKQATVISRDPRKLKNTSIPSSSSQLGSGGGGGGGEKFEFFTRQIPELNHPTPLALDNNNKKIGKKTQKLLAVQQQQKPDNDKKRHSIYRCPKNQIKSRKDDVDLRFPFKPVMANYIPAKEIDASITSHACIPYKVYEVDIPLTDYAEIRQNIILPTDEILDPRLRKLLESDSENDDTDNDDDVNDDDDESTKNDIDDEQKIIENSGSSIRDLSSSTAAKSQSTPIIIQKRIDPRCAEPRIDPRTDPRRRAAAATIMDPSSVSSSSGTMTTTTTTTTTTSSSSSSMTTPANIDVQLILQSSDWYTNLSSKQKIMVNQQLALLSSELKRHHMDTNQNKMFDMTFIQINVILQTILTNLNIFINDQGQIVQLPNNTGGDTEFLHQPPPPLPLQQHHQQQQHLQMPPTQSIGLLGHAPPGAEILGIPKSMHPNIMGPPRFGGNRMMFDNSGQQQLPPPPPAGIMGMNSMFNEHDGGTNYLPTNMFDGRQGGGYFGGGGGGGNNRDDRSVGNRNFRGGCHPQRHQSQPPQPPPSSSMPSNNNDRWTNCNPGGPPIMRGNNRNQMGGGNRRNMNYDNRDRMWRDK